MVRYSVEQAISVIESRRHVGVYHYLRGFPIEKVSDFADAMNVEICHATHMI